MQYLILYICLNSPIISVIELAHPLHKGKVQVYFDMIAVPFKELDIHVNRSQSATVIWCVYNFVPIYDFVPIFKIN